MNRIQVGETATRIASDKSFHLTQKKTKYLTSEKVVGIAHHGVRVNYTESIHLAEFSTERTGDRPAIIAVHGTGDPGYGDRRWRLRFGRRAAAEGFRFYLFDSRGTGYSDGEFEDWTVSRFVEDATRALEFVREQPNVDADRVAVLGFSLGSAVVVLVAHQHSSWIRSLLVYTLPCDMDRGFPWYFERFAPRSLDSFYGNKGRVWLPPLGQYLERSFLLRKKNQPIHRQSTCGDLIRYS